MELEPRILSRSSSLIVRLALPSELDRWRALMREHHYLGFERIVGKALHYVAAFEEQMGSIARLGVSSFEVLFARPLYWLGKTPTIQTIAPNRQHCLDPTPCS